ncbi:hypothetical protein IWQ62_004147, partial [Dispira parvispora]
MRDRRLRKKQMEILRDKFQPVSIAGTGQDHSDAIGNNRRVIKTLPADNVPMVPRNFWRYEVNDASLYYYNTTHFVQPIPMDLNLARGTYWTSFLAAPPEDLLRVSPLVFLLRYGKFAEAWVLVYEMKRRLRHTDFTRALRKSIPDIADLLQAFFGSSVDIRYTGGVPTKLVRNSWRILYDVIYPLYFTGLLVNGGPYDWMQFINSYEWDNYSNICINVFYRMASIMSKKKKVFLEDLIRFTIAQPHIGSIVSEDALFATPERSEFKFRVINQVLRIRQQNFEFPNMVSHK